MQIDTYIPNVEHAEFGMNVDATASLARWSVYSPLEGSFFKPLSDEYI
jgi:hypothetical protein